jgi:ATP-dependent Clp protease ATP-binding subunit ClpA
MNIEQFTDKAREALRIAAEIATEQHHSQIDVEHLLAEMGYDPQFGVRPLKCVIQREVENPIARGILNGTIHDGDMIKIDAKDGKLVMTPIKRRAEQRAHAG